MNEQTSTTDKAFDLGRQLQREQIIKQARQIAKHLLTMSLGKPTPEYPIQKLILALAKKSIKFGIIQNEKTLSIEMPWDRIRGHSEEEIAEWITQKMMGEMETLQ